MDPANDTIVAVATAAGRSGIGIVRLSGPDAFSVADAIVTRLPEPGVPVLARFRGTEGELLDEGLVLGFRAPASYTGEDVLELHGHGSPVVLDQLVETCVALGARIAMPGEFSRRAFENDKLDLAQAEAVADLIDAGTRSAARSAMRSLTGEFSRRVDSVVESLTTLRIMMEAAIDFPEEEIDFLSDGDYEQRIDTLLREIEGLGAAANQGVLLASGVRVVLAGRPNAGKSSLMNALAGEDRAIVSATPGTTRDTVEVRIQLDGLPVSLTDTAGLRETKDDVESEGVRRARVALGEADMILHVVDSAAATTDPTQMPDSGDTPVIVVRNKCDLSGEAAGRHGITGSAAAIVAISAETGAGIDELTHVIREVCGYVPGEEDTIVARRRHVEAIRRGEAFVQEARNRLVNDAAGDLAAEDLRLAQRAFGEITGTVTSDDLLGLIFSSFCIGK